MRIFVATALGLLSLATIAMAEPPVRDTEPGWYEVSVDGGEVTIPFDLWIPPEGDPRPAYIKNAEEYIAISDFENTEDQLVIRFPHYDSTLYAVKIPWQGKVILEGAWVKTRRDGPAVMAFTGERILSLWPRMTEGSSEENAWTHRRTGVTSEARYAVDFDQSGEAILIVHQTGRRSMREDDSTEDRYREIHATVLTPTGDYRYLSGSLDTEGRLYVTVFDGAHAFKISADVDPATGDLTNGHFYSGNHWHETFTARRLADGEAYELPDPFSEVTLKSGVTRLGIPKLNEAPYAGKPTIVQVFGTWCPNCHDEAPVLVDLYTRYHADGLQILSLAYEYTDDPERSNRQIQRYKDRFGATWEFVAAGVNDKAKTAATLPALSAIKSYPTTIWINPDGTVRAIHSGFAGPATGDAYTETLEHFEEKTAEIVGRARPRVP